ncbi:GyrI-like domain-containing protein [Shimazuella alba]|uniref:Integron-associated effector binding protein domain-containing protein n=1 Tax=Shimazuella alba TaxID=2690964 RepID=A0A6I4W3P4_9BACL|nr:effector binding domain-containing protein [Shimazuella alba]MXQ54922.1 hypothetical protein [Shimazuella alba]
MKDTAPIYKNGVFVPGIDQTTYKNMQTYFKQVSMEQVDEILYIAVDHAVAECPNSFIELIIAKQQWAVFVLSSTSQREFYNTWYYLFSVWFLTNRYELVENAQFSRVIKADALYELWIPVARIKS